MISAPEAVITCLRKFLEADPATGCVVLGGFERVPAGKDWIAERAKGKTLILLGLDPVTHEQPTQGVPEETRWQQNLSLVATTLYGLKDGDDPWARRFADGAWLTALLAGFCSWVGDPRQAGAKLLSKADIGIPSVLLAKTEYAPGDGADLDAGFVSVQASLEIVIEAANVTSTPPALKGVELGTVGAFIGGAPESGEEWVVGGLGP